MRVEEGVQDRLDDADGRHHGAHSDPEQGGPAEIRVRADEEDRKAVKGDHADQHQRQSQAVARRRREHERGERADSEPPAKTPLDQADSKGGDAPGDDGPDRQHNGGDQLQSEIDAVPADPETIGRDRGHQEDEREQVQQGGGHRPAGTQRHRIRVVE